MTIELTADTKTIASLEEGGERFEARNYEKKDGFIDVVRSAADGSILEKLTFEWDGDYVLFEATLSHVGGDDFELEIFGEHWKGCMPLRKAFRFSRTKQRV